MAERSPLFPLGYPKYLYERKNLSNVKHIICTFFIMFTQPANFKQYNYTYTHHYVIRGESLALRPEFLKGTRIVCVKFIFRFVNFDNNNYRGSGANAFSAAKTVKTLTSASYRHSAVYFRTLNFRNRA